MEEESVFVVADGVGGSNSGEIASRTVTRGIANYIRRKSPDDVEHDDMAEYLLDAVNEVNEQVYELATSFAENKGMATTLVMGVIKDEKLYVVNVGDSRCYIFRDDELKLITDDHTYVNSLVKAGIITQQQAENHKDKNMILRAIGAESTVEADIFTIDLKQGDTIMLCTDGLYSEVCREEIIEEFKRTQSMKEAADNLIKLANDNGGSDNITLVCIKVLEEEIDE